MDEVKAGPCPYESNGVLGVWLMRSGRLALVCDECDGTWFDRSTMSWDNFQVPRPEWKPLDRSTFGRRIVAWLKTQGFMRTPDPDFVFPDGDAIERPATAEEIRDRGWGDLIPD